MRIVFLHSPYLLVFSGEVILLIMAYCTEANLEVSPGVWTYNYTKDDLAQMGYGCCQKFVCGIECPKVGAVGARNVCCQGQQASGYARNSNIHSQVCHAQHPCASWARLVAGHT